MYASINHANKFQATIRIEQYLGLSPSKPDVPRP